MSYLILFSAIAGGLLLYLLSGSSANTEIFSVNYYGLLGLTGLLALGLTGMVGYQLWRLRIKLKNKVFGAKLTLRLVLFFMLIAVLPGILVYAPVHRCRAASRGWHGGTAGFRSWSWRLWVGRE